MRRYLPFTSEEEARLAIQSQLDQGLITKAESTKEDYFKRLVIEKEYERGWRELLRGKVQSIFLRKSLAFYLTKKACRVTLLTSHTSWRTNEQH